MLFGVIRSKGRWNNNPSTSQFVSAYRRLLVNVQLKDEKRGGNCWPIETVAILYVTSKPDAALRMDAEDEDLIRDSDHTYARSLCQIGVPLSTFVGDVVEYIAGFFVRKSTTNTAAISAQWFSSERLRRGLSVGKTVVD